MIERNAPLFPLGPTTATGIIVPAQISILRRGSHLLRIGTSVPFYLESTKISLSSLSGTLVKVEGMLEENSLKGGLPVLVVERIEELSSPKAVAIPELGLSVQIPSQWSVTRKGATVQITPHWRSGAIITLTTTFDAPENPSQRIMIGSLAAYKLPSVVPTYLLLRREEPFALLTLSAGADRRVEVESILSTFQDTMNGSSLSSSKRFSSGSGTLSGSNTPCGGSAGLLCPKGEFCEVLDIERRIGRCRSQ